MKPVAARVVEVTEANIAEHPGAICFINPRHPLYRPKVEWLRKRFSEGLRIRLLYLPGENRPRHGGAGRPAGFIETVPGESCWRAVKAEGYLFIHCLWTTGSKIQHQGLGSLLLQEAEREARGMRGVAALASDGSFMAKQKIFLKNGYAVVAESGTEQLLSKRFKKGPLPAIHDWRAELTKRQGWSIIYSKQCPWVARFIEEARPIFAKFDLQPIVTELKTAAQAQQAPSLYGVFSLIHNGKLLADRYISTTRLATILKKAVR
ncbi:MAG: N-acetyltransferase [Acidobacteria bacterium]|jgi:hypothetical protein|nr:N-acetyltransferase [Acidobacteriota bacterium]